MAKNPEKTSIESPLDKTDTYLKRLREYENRLLIRVNYDLLQVPGYIDKEHREPPQKTAESIEYPERYKNSKSLPKRGKLTRASAANPAPPSHSFAPDWVDKDTGVEYSLAEIDHPFVEEKLKSNRGSIVFWARARGKLDDGRSRQFPLLHTQVTLMDLQDGSIIARGYVSERYFTRKRVMGIIVMNPLIWREGAPLPKAD